MSNTGGLHWQVDGPPEAEPLLLCSGLGGTAGYWQPNIAALAQNFRVIRYDHRGTGQSDHALAGPVTIDTMADDLIALLDLLGIERVSFIGHAMGGLVGLALALRAPDRLANLIVVNGWAAPDRHFLRCLDIRLALLRDGGPRAWVRAQPLFLYPAAWISDHLAEIDAAEEGHVAAFPDVDVVGRRVDALRRFDIAARLGEITMPVLLIAAEDDMLVPCRCSQKLAEGIKLAELKTLPRGGHACNVTMPHVFEAYVLGWLNRIGQR